MKSLFRSLLFAGMLFFVYSGSAQLPKRIGMIGVSTAIANFGSSDDVTGPYLHVQPEIGIFIGQHFAIGPYINISSLSYNGSPYTAYGLGMFIGTQISGRAVDHYALAEGHNWKGVWFIPAYIALGVLIYFILFFREKRQIRVAGLPEDVAMPEVA
jgi:hypothetical protein